MSDYQLPDTVEKLRTLLPVIEAKEKQGLILPSFRKATDLVEWGVKYKRVYSDKQLLFVGRLILRAERKHKGGKGVELNQNIVQTVDVEKVAEQVLGIIGNKAIDVDKVAKVVLAEIDKRKPPVVEIVVQREDGKKAKVKGPQHYKFKDLLLAATGRINGMAPGIFLAGEASSGKTTGARMVAEALGTKWHFNGAISFPHEMLGFIDGAGKYHRTPFREAYENGGIYTFDEVDRSDPVALLAVNPALAGDVATFPDKQVKRHKDCVLICTANTWGLGANSEYSGATKLDAAFLSRFPVRISWDIDEALESQIVTNAKWLARVRNARARARAVGLKVMIDTRVAQAGEALIKLGFVEQEAADMTYLANLKPEQRKQIEGIAS